LTCTKDMFGFRRRRGNGVLEALVALSACTAAAAILLPSRSQLLSLTGQGLGPLGDSAYASFACMYYRDMSLRSTFLNATNGYAGSFFGNTLTFNGRAVNCTASLSGGALGMVYDVSSARLAA